MDYYIFTSITQVSSPFCLEVTGVPFDVIIGFEAGDLVQYEEKRIKLPESLQVDSVIGAITALGSFSPDNLSIEIIQVNDITLSVSPKNCQGEVSKR